ncbi:MAG: type IV pilus biogenesis/stability protein PilW [Psychrobium sp.]|nr:type IV pilus biogenesis/stability protein PilW [Psychrobium sp.]
MNNVTLFGQSGLMIMLLCITLSGCVTKEYVRGPDNTLIERTFNSKEAAMARLKLALEYLRHGRTAQAKLNLDRAAATNSAIDGIDSSYAYYYQHVGDIDMADKSYRKALNSFPNNYNTRNNYGAFLCDNQRFVAAQRQFDLVLNTPSNAQVANSLENSGLCALRDNDWPLARKQLNAVIGYEKNRVRSILGLVKAEMELGNYPQSVLHLTNYKKVYVVTQQSLWLDVKLAHRLGNDDVVRKLGGDLVNKYPNSQAAKSFLDKDFK